MWLFLTRRLRMWLLLTVLVPIATKVLRRLGLALQRGRGPNPVSNALIKAGDLGDQTAARLRGKRGGQGRRRG